MNCCPSTTTQRCADRLTCAVVRAESGVAAAVRPRVRSTCAGAAEKATQLDHGRKSIGMTISFGTGLEAHDQTVEFADQNWGNMMRRFVIALCMLFGSITPALAQVSVGIGVAVPGLSIGINLPAYPQLVRVTGYPVYYAPQLGLNLFFYDGMYWVFQNDNWYASTWYNGPWGLINPWAVPVYLLQVPVRYYRAPPPYFRGWGVNAAPRWGEHWGPQWEQSHPDWNRSNANVRRAPAPLPTYQRQYSGNRYPQAEQQAPLHSQNYRYQPHEPVVQQHYQQGSVHHGEQSQLQSRQQPGSHENEHRH